MGDVVELRHKDGRPQSNARVGLIILLGLWSMMFAGLVFTWVFVRLQEPTWPPEGTPPLPRAAAALALALLVLSAALLLLGVRALRQDRTGPHAALQTLALAAALGFIAAQSAVLLPLRAGGFGGSYGTLFLTWMLFHLVHVAVGVPGLVVTTARALRRRYTAQHHVGVSVWTGYQVYAAAMAGLMYVALFWL